MDLGEPLVRGSEASVVDDEDLNHRRRIRRELLPCIEVSFALVMCACFAYSMSANTWSVTDDGVTLGLFVICDDVLGCEDIGGNCTWRNPPWQFMDCGMRIPTIALTGVALASTLTCTGLLLIYTVDRLNGCASCQRKAAYVSSAAVHVCGICATITWSAGTDSLFSGPGEVWRPGLATQLLCVAWIVPPVWWCLLLLLRTA
jgi:hypothetical protein